MLNLNVKKIQFILILFLVSTTINSKYVHAQGSVGNGGGGEALFENQTDMLSLWMDRQFATGTLDSKLNLTAQKLSGRDLVFKFKNAVKVAHVKFIPTQELARECKKGDLSACTLIQPGFICVPDRKRLTIECSEDSFAAHKGNEQFVLALHAYLEFAGLESRRAIDADKSFSEFPVSQHILRYAVQIETSPRWELSDQIPNICKIQISGDVGGEISIFSASSFIFGPTDSSNGEEFFQFAERKGYVRCNPYTYDCIDAGNDLHIEVTYGTRVMITLNSRIGTDKKSSIQVFKYYLDLRDVGFFENWYAYSNLKTFLFKTKYFPSCAQLNEMVGKNGQELELNSKNRELTVWRVQ